MAMDGTFYAYDVTVPLAELTDAHRKDVGYTIVKDGAHRDPLVTYEEATRPEEQRVMEQGWPKYEAWLEHDKACKARMLNLAIAAFPELVATEMPTLWLEIPGFDATHATVWLEVAQ
jgi:hypothetical protein